MKLKFVFLFFAGVFFFKNTLHSQNDALKFDFVNPQIHLYAVGESHVEKNVVLQFEIIKYLQKSAHLKTVIQEIPVEVGEVLNQIALTGENRELVKELFQHFPRQAKRDGIALMDSIISMNQKLTYSDKVGIKGIDLIYYPDHYFVVSTLRIIFPELKNCSVPLVKEYLFSKKKPKLKKEMSLLVLKELLEDISKNMNIYQNCLGTRIKNYQMVLHNIVHYKELSEWSPQAAFREKILTENLIPLITTHSVSLLICGSSHLTRIENDEELLWDTSYPTMIANSYEVYPNSIFTIITQYYKEKKWLSRWIFGETNFLKNPMGTYIDKKNTKYKVLTGEELKKNSKVLNRCDMIIIQNNKYK